MARRPLLNTCRCRSLPRPTTLLLLIDGSDNQRIDRRLHLREIGRSHGTRGDQHALTNTAAKDIEGDERGAVVQSDLKQGAVWHRLNTLGGPDLAGYAPAN